MLEKLKTELASLEKELATILTPDVMARINFINGAKQMAAHLMAHLEEIARNDEAAMKEEIKE